MTGRQPEAVAPVAEVGGDDEEAPRVLQVPASIMIIYQ